MVNAATTCRPNRLLYTTKGNRPVRSSLLGMPPFASDAGMRQQYTFYKAYQLLAIVCVALNSPRRLPMLCLPAYHIQLNGPLTALVLGSNG